ncbi:TPA: hypothetical protein RUW99_003657 [Aeromonas veronii]|nr:hypothetical protein [Aeromonas veronii]
MAQFQNYYVNNNSQPTGEHEVHTDSCRFFDQIRSKQYLGTFVTCAEALRAARNYYANVDGCQHCAPACHHR